MYVFMCMWVWERMAARASRRLSLGGEASTRSKRRPAQTLPLAPFWHLTSPQTNLFTPYSHLPRNSLWSDFCSHNFPETIFTKGLVLSAFYSMDTFQAFPCQTFCHIQVCYLVFSLKFWPPGHKDLSTCSRFLFGLLLTVTHPLGTQCRPECHALPTSLSPWDDVIGHVPLN